MAQNHGADHLGSTLWPIGSHWVQKWVTTVKYCHAPKFEFSTGHRFRPKFDFTVMAQNHGVDHLGSTLWTMGSHWVQKKVKTVKKYHDSNFRLPAVIDFGQNSTLRLWRQHRKKLPYPQIRIFTYPAVVNFDQNSSLRLWRQITVGTP